MSPVQMIGGRYQFINTLGEDTYNSAWERGKSLDLETVVQELLAEYDEEDES